MSKSAVLVCCLLSALIWLTFAAEVKAEWLESATTELSLGYRVDQLDWNIAGNLQGESPNVLSELTWDDIESIQLRLDATVLTRKLAWLRSRLLTVGYLGYGQIYAGDNQDSDYAGDNRTQELFRSNNHTDDGYTFDGGWGVGPSYQLGEKTFLSPLIGYSIHIQDLSITDGYQTVSIHPELLGPIAGLDSSYRAYWYGPWLGLQLELHPASSWSLELRGEYHKIEYFAEADWNLRTDLDHPTSFEHDADGSGFSLSLQSSYQLTAAWEMYVSGAFQRWKADDGKDTTYLVDGGRIATRLNEVNWESVALSCGLSYRF